jgi:hypothetical protein
MLDIQGGNTINFDLVGGRMQNDLSSTCGPVTDSAAFEL